MKKSIKIVWTIKEENKNVLIKMIKIGTLYENMDKQYEWNGKWRKKIIGWDKRLKENGKACDRDRVKELT